MSTKDRILDAAERLFARDGFEATSLRAITTEAGVNLAAVNYHFQSKEALVQAVIGRRMGPINQRRLALLDAAESEAENRAVPLDQILDAFLRPVLEIVGSHAREFAPLIGRLYTEPGDFSERVFKDQFQPLAQRFIPAFQRALPDLPPTDLYWRLHFSIGAMAHTMGATTMLRVFSRGLCDPSDIEGTLARMKTFVLAGLAAPVPAAPVSMEVQHAAR
jgi:AcrR family transcriptional regulator